MGVTLLFSGAIRYICCLTPQMKCVANISLNMLAWKLYFWNRFIFLIDRGGCVFFFFEKRALLCSLLKSSLSGLSSTV